MRFLIVNQHTMNYGDDIAGLSLIQQLLSRFSDKNTKIDIIYNTKGMLNIDDDRVNHQIEVTLKNIGYLQLIVFFIFSLINIEIIFNQKLKDFKNLVKKSDVIFVSPCGANIGIYQDWRFLIRLWLVVKFGGRPIFHGNTIGKSRNFLFNLMALYILRRSVLYVREFASYEYLKGYNISATRTVDTGFLFQNNKLFKGESNYTVFIPTSIDTWHPDFKDVNVTELIKNKVLNEYVRLILKENWKLVILPHLYKEMDEKELLNSYKKKFIQLGISEELITIPTLNDCYDYDNYIKHSKFVVSMRYHGAIMSIKNQVPFVSLAYENKMKEACRYSNLEFLNINISDLVYEESINLRDVWDRKDEIQKIMDNTSSQLEILALQCLNQYTFLVKE